MKRRHVGRRTFLARTLAAAGSSLLVDRLSWPAVERTGDTPVAKSPPTLVFELYFKGLRDAEGRAQAYMVEDFGLVSAAALTGEEFPLDGLAELFPEESSVAILVDARAGSATTPTIVKRLARALVEIGSPPETVRILDANDEALASAGYEIARTGPGTFCHGTMPRPGYGEAVAVPGAQGSAGLSKSALPSGATYLAVVGSLSADADRMGPFVIDAALGVVDDRARARASSDPEFGARLLASEMIGGRIAMVIGDLVEVRLTSSPAPAGEGSVGKDGTRFRGDEVISGTNVFAVERIGHRILCNTRAARGLRVVPPHPVLAAAEALGLRGSAMDSIDWKKGSM